MEYLVISAISPHKPNLIIRELAHLAARNDCHIEHSRMVLLGSEIAVVMLLSGSWNTIAKVEAALPSLERELNISTIIKRTKQNPLSEDSLPYTVQVIALDQPDIVFSLSNFFMGQNVTIYDLQSSTYKASLTETKMFSLTMRIGITNNSNIVDLREQFAVLCEELNLDGVMEPDKF